MSRARAPRTGRQPVGYRADHDSRSRDECAAVRLRETRRGSSYATASRAEGKASSNSAKSNGEAPRSTPGPSVNPTVSLRGTSRYSIIWMCRRPATQSATRSMPTGWKWTIAGLRTRSPSSTRLPQRGRRCAEDEWCPRSRGYAGTVRRARGVAATVPRPLSGSWTTGRGPLITDLSIWIMAQRSRHTATDRMRIVPVSSPAPGEGLADPAPTRVRGQNPCQLARDPTGR